MNDYVTTDLLTEEPSQSPAKRPIKKMKSDEDLAAVLMDRNRFLKEDETDLFFRAMAQEAKKITNEMVLCDLKFEIHSLIHTRLKENM